MEKASTPNKKDLIRDIAANPETAYTFIHTLYTALEMSQEVFYDLIWERGGKIDPFYESYVSSLNTIIRDILERTNDGL